jgi:predicted nucleic acid-binding protein
MRAYLDASVLVALLTDDPLTARADTFLRINTPVLVLSDFAAAEFASAMARRVRGREITVEDARAAFSTLDVWAARVTQRVETTAADVKLAEAALRRLDLTLRTPDALNIAIAQRVGAMLVTFDAKMASSARALGTEVAAA